MDAPNHAWSDARAAMNQARHPWPRFCFLGSYEELVNRGCDQLEARQQSGVGIGPSQVKASPW